MARPATGKGPKKQNQRSGPAVDPFSLSFLGTWAGPPPGTYDPSKQYEVEKSRTGLQQLLEHNAEENLYGTQSAEQRARELRRSMRWGNEGRERERGYLQTDYEHQLGDLTTGHQRTIEGLGINFARDIEDLSRARQRGEEDYGRTLTDLQHRYGSVAEQQNQAFVQQGTNEGGTETASAAVRAANQGYDKGGIDLSHNRSLEDFATREQRLNDTLNRRVGEENTDYATQTSRFGEGLSRKLASLATAGQHEGAETLSQMRGIDHARQHEQKQREIQDSQKKAQEIGYERAQSLQAYYEAHQLHPKIKFPGSSIPNLPTPGANPTFVGAPGQPKTLGASAFGHPQRYRRHSLGY